MAKTKRKLASKWYAVNRIQHCPDTLYVHFPPIFSGKLPCWFEAKQTRFRYILQRINSGKLPLPWYVTVKCFIP